MLFRCPCGTDPISRSPREQRPLSRTMLVLVAVSSINTNRAGLSIPCSLIQRRRPRATSGRSCSAARRLFFDSYIMSLEMSLEKSPDGGAAARDSALVHRGDHLIQGQIRLLGYQSQQPIRALLQRRRTPSARLCPGASSLAPALKPPHRRTGAEPVVFGSLTPRRPGFHGFDNTLSQVVRIRLRHRFGPQTPNQCLQTRLPKDTWESPRFNHAGMCSKMILSCCGSITFCSEISPIMRSRSLVQPLSGSSMTGAPLLSSVRRLSN